MRPPRLTHPLALVVTSLACGCGGPRAAPAAPSAPAAVGEPAPAPAPERASPRLPAPGVEPRAEPPPALAIDGDLAEWGAATGARPPVHVVFTQDGLAVAGVVPPGADGVDVTLKFAVPPVPPIGFPEPGGGVRELRCDDPVLLADPSFGSDVVAACETILAARDAVAAEHASRFQATYRIAPGGVSCDGTPVGAAPSRWGESRRERVFEVTIPLAAFPEVADTRIHRGTVEAQFVGGGAASAVETATLEARHPIRFGRALNAREMIAMTTHGELPAYPRSYLPGDGGRVRVVHYASADRLRLVSTVHELVGTTIHFEGGMEVAEVFGNGPRVAILTNGFPLEVLPLQLIEGTTVVKRGRGAHAFGWQRTGDEGACPGVGLLAAEIRPDGSRGSVADPPPPPEAPGRCWWPVHASADAAAEVFEVHEVQEVAGRRAGRIVTWRWTPRPGVYRRSVRAADVPRP